MIRKSIKAVCSFLLVLVMALGMVSTTAFAAPGSVLTAATAEEFLAALSDAEAGDTVKLADGEYVINTAIYLQKSITIEGSGSTVITFGPEVKFDSTGERYGFIADKAVEGDIVLKDLTVKGSGKNLALLWIKNTDAAGVSIRLENCNLSNVGSATYNHAISFEYAKGGSKYYFDLAVIGGSIEAGSYGIGSGLDNGNPDVSDCTLFVSGVDFVNQTGSGSIYCIHTPKAFASLTVTDNTFTTVRSGGIKYIYTPDNKESVVIKDNDFSACNKEMTTGSYAIMVTNQIRDLTDKYCYVFGTEVSGNNLKGQNTILAAAAALEVFWFPDGQAVNDTLFNNFANENATDAGTRYGMSKWGGNKNFIVLTDFDIADAALTFLVGDGDKTSSYYYNSLTSSGAYTNAVEGFNSYFTDENPRHCGASLATWGEANAITRFTLDGVAFVQDVETGEDDTEILLSTWTAENDVAKVVIDTATGAITVTPKAVGETKLVGTVGAGADGTLPNGKDDELIITVKEDEVLGDEEEPKEDPKEDPKDDEVLGDEENPGTGDAVLLSVLALAGSATLAGASFKKFRK